MKPYDLTKELISTIFNDNLEGLVTTIIAPSGLGKTTLTCMQLPIYLYKQMKGSGVLSDKDVLLIMNTDKSLLNQRFLEICRAFELNYSDVRANIKFLDLKNFDDQHNAIIYKIPEMIRKNQYNIRYLVVDPFNHFLRRIFAETKPEYRLNVVGRLTPKLEHQMNVLSDLSRDHNVIVFCTLLPKKQYANTIPQAWQNAYFGPLEVAHLSDIVTWFNISKQHENSIEARVLKHRLKPTPFSKHIQFADFGLKLMVER